MKPTKYHKYTDADVQYMREHRYDDPQEVAVVLGASMRTVDTYMRKIRKGTLEQIGHPPLKYYALYLRKTDKLVCSGTAKECAEQLGVSMNAFYTMAHKALHGKTKKWEAYVERYAV